MEKKVIRVLQVIRKMDLGGAETILMNLYRNIDRSCIQFDFLVAQEGFFDHEIKNMGGKIYYIDYITQIGQLRYEKRLKEFFMEHNEYVIVHSHLDQVSGIVMKAAKKAGVPIRISHSHNTNNTNGFIGKIYKSYLQSMIKSNANQYFACGKEAAKWLYKKQANQAIIMNNGINLNQFKYSLEKRKKIRNELKVTDETTIIGHVGRFSKQKNHQFLIEIFKEYQKKNANSLLVLVGKGDLEEECRKQVKQLGIEDKVKFLGTRQDMDAIYSAFDLMIFPSLFEGLSLVLIEAQATGLTIFASDTIDKKTNVTNNIHFISLQNSAKQWLDEIQKQKIKRDEMADIKVKDSGYSIEEIAKKMQKYYQQKVQEVEKNEINNSNNTNL